jgi:hypothetical protein
MPQQVDFVNGKVVITGDDTAHDHIPMPDAPAAPAPKAKPKPKPKGKAAPPPKPWWQNLPHVVGNELRYAGKVIQSLEATQKGGPRKPGPWTLVDLVNPVGGLARQAGRYSPTFRQAYAAATYGAAQTAGEGIISIGQHMFKGAKFAEPKVSRPGQLLNAITRAGYAATGAKQPEDLTEAQRSIIDTQARMLGVEVGTGVLTPELKLFQGAGMVSKGLRLGTRLGVAHGVSAFTQDSTLGNMSNMAEAATGQKVPGAVDPLKDDRVTAGMKSVLPNMIGGEALGLGIAAGGRVAGKLGDQFPNIARQRRARRANTEHTTANEAVKATGLVEDVDGRQQFTDAARAKPAPMTMTVDERTQQILDRFGGPSKPAAPAAAAAEQPATATIRTTGPEQPAPASTAGQGFAPTTIRATGPSQKWRDSFSGDGSQSPTIRATGPSQLRGDAWQGDGQPVTIRATGPSQPWREGPRVADGLDPEPIAPQGPDDPAYQDWLRRNASNALVPTAPPESGLDMLPRQPLAPQDTLRGENLVDPWAMGPDPNSPVQQALGQKPGATEQAPPPPVDPAEEFFNNGHLPEIADVTKTLDGMSLPELKAAAIAADNGGSVLEHIDAITASRPALRIRPEVSEDATGMPTANLADIYITGIANLEPWIKQFDKIPSETLHELAHPEASPRLFDLIHASTGRDWEAFTRPDIINGIQELSAQGLTILPNRLKGDVTLRPTNSIIARPREFQYKENVNAKGEQIGHSLSGIDKWNPNMEGVLDVYSDPVTGEVAVVNGHNRRALAERLGVPSLMTKEVDATTIPGARAEGALANIAQGAGTAFDAAKFIRESKIEDPTQLSAAGIPTDRGFGKQGFALSRLPSNIFQDAVNNTHEIDLGRFVDLGASGLDEPGMRSAYKYLVNKPKMQAGRFKEVIDLTKAQPTVVAMPQDGQTTILGAEYINTVENLTKLADTVRRGLGKEKRIFSHSAKHADLLGETGVASVNTATAGELVNDATHALALFDKFKYASGPMGDILKAGAERIAKGENAEFVTKQIQKDIVNSIETVLNEVGLKRPGRPAAPAPAAAITPEIVPPEPTRAELEQHLLNHATADGEVRPTETGPVAVPEGLNGDWGDMQHEHALGADYYSQDTMAAHDAKKAMREAEGYDFKSWEERLQESRVGEEWLAPAPDAVAQKASGESSASLTFTTERGGSVYTVNPDGGTTRVKGASNDPVHLGDIGPKPASKLTVYVDPDTAKLLGDIYLQGQYKPDFKIKDGKLLFKDYKITRMEPTEEAIDANLPGKIKSVTPRITELPFSTTPKVGLHPVEVGDGWKHVGSKINNVAPAPDAITPEVLPPEGAPPNRPISGKFKKLLGDMAKTDAAMFREIGGMIGEIKNMVGDAPVEQGAKSPGLPAPARKALVASQVSNAPPFVLPQELNKAAPRYGNKQLQFESDLDRTAYMLASDRTKGASKAAEKYREALAAAGFDVDQVAAHGALVKQAVKDGVKDADGATAVIPVQPFGGDTPRLPLPEQGRKASKAKQQITDLKNKLNEGGCGL